MIQNTILYVDKLNILGWQDDIIRNDGFCNRTSDTFALKDGGKTEEILTESIN